MVFLRRLNVTPSAFCLEQAIVGGIVVTSKQVRNVLLFEKRGQKLRLDFVVQHGYAFQSSHVPEC